METCIITGAGSGIGKAVAIELAKRRMFLKYVLIGRNEEAMSKTVNRMAEYVPTESIFFYKAEFAFPEKLPSLMKFKRF